MGDLCELDEMVERWAALATSSRGAFVLLRRGFPPSMSVRNHNREVDRFLGVQETIVWRDFSLRDYSPPMLTRQPALALS